MALIEYDVYKQKLREMRWTWTERVRKRNA